MSKGLYKIYGKTGPASTELDAQKYHDPVVYNTTIT